MPDSDTPAYRIPSPDAGHEAIRAPLADAIDRLTAVTTELNDTKVGVDDAYFLTDLLFGLIDTAIAQQAEITQLLDAHRIRIDAVNVRCDTAVDGMDALQARLAELESKVALLEGHHVTLPGPDAAG